MSKCLSYKLRAIGKMGNVLGSKISAIWRNRYFTNLECKFQWRPSGARFERRFATDSDASNDPQIAGVLFDGRMRKGQLNSRPRHLLVGFAAECDGLQDFPCVRTIGSASRLELGLHRRAADKLQRQASSVVVWHVSESNRPLNIFKKLLSLWFW
jgi:hypothetical protein